jgi:hypothetical protein
MVAVLVTEDLNLDMLGLSQESGGIIVSFNRSDKGYASNRSKKTESFPNALKASDLAESKALSSESPSRITRIPRPPPVDDVTSTDRHLIYFVYVHICMDSHTAKACFCNHRTAVPVQSSV